MQGQDARININTAVQAVSNIIKSSFGPKGLDKMIIDDHGSCVVTNDGNIILSKLQIEHPAAKILVQLSELQAKENGDGTTSVVLLAAELLKKATQLSSMKIHPNLIIRGYKTALKECIIFARRTLIVKDTNYLKACARTSLSSKLADREHLVKIICEACLITNKPKMITCHGQSLKETSLFNGYVIKSQRVSQQMPSKVKHAKIACLNVALQLQRFRGQIQVGDAADLEKIKNHEYLSIRKNIDILLHHGVNVILTSHGIDESIASYLVQKGCLAIRSIPMRDLRSIASATKGQIFSQFCDMDGNDAIDPSHLGSCKIVQEKAIGDQNYIYFESKRAASVIIRGPNEMFCDEIKSSLKKSIKLLARVQNTNQMCSGGGSFEMALHIYLHDLALRIPSLLQGVVQEFSEALLIIPIVLCGNGNFDTFEMIGKLKQVHAFWQKRKDTKGLKYTGLNLQEGGIQNCLTAGVVESLEAKISMLKLATEVAITLCRIDSIQFVQ